ncbi:hypothetical protein H6G89_29130 [Oscillatoria sp. FACHB-1407]|uniref:hypothetical protein n=1 Tax=Oscillatoria sp. FACHB-1407 TaxID=2692847 RepID=UPI001686C21D|nr:hypothetical protein [Oscillatoria sp. FACHB-1407]MBD2465075.1 hypothetical protein [Oscillatoria sp. FACHB-1407]
MTSPFSSFEEFSSAEGPIYTFANNPTVIAILLIICALMTIYFVYASYTMKLDSKSPDAKAIGLLLVAGFASVMGTLFNPNTERREAVNPRHSHEMRAERSNWQPLALLGMVGLGGAAKGRSSKRRSSRKVRRIQ